RRLTAGARARHLDLEGAHAVLLSLLGGVLGGHLGGIGRRFTRALEAHGAGRRPGDGVSLCVGNGDHRVIEGRVHGRDSGSDVLAFASANAGGFFAHSRSSRGSGRRVPGRYGVLAFDSGLTSSCRRSAWPAPCGCEHWYGYADRGQVVLGGAATHDSSRGPSA